MLKGVANHGIVLYEACAFSFSMSNEYDGDTHEGAFGFCITGCLMEEYTNSDNSRQRTAERQPVGVDAIIPPPVGIQKDKP
ncbi:MAG: hypothetical protein A3K90_00675 [Pelodictyon luteolum]|uniref:Uncharacterized protein n=1 Tax=Pelodictyon luteolum TaxID=1100 RepID=A0A165L025_PELLU|nr:MAG: hypothetical protein A3K90_00675 [Pelodictyon luteolum]